MIFNPSYCEQAKRSRGFTMLEVVVSTMVLGLASVAILKATLTVDRGRQTSERLDYASRELDNLMERFTSRPWEEINAQTATELLPPLELLQHFPQAKLETTVEEIQESFKAKRITMRLQCGTSKLTGKPLSLTAWKFPPPEEETSEQSPEEPAP